MKRVPVSLIHQWDKVPDGIANAIKILKVICLGRVHLFIRYIPCYKVQRVFDIFCIWCNMFDGAVQRYGVEVTTLEIWFGWGLRVVRKLDVDDVVIFSLGDYTTSREITLFHRNMFRVWIWCLKVSTFWSHISLLFSHLADINCFLLLCVIRQSKSWFYWSFINVHTIVYHPFIVCNWRHCGGYQWVSKYTSVSKEVSISHLIVVVRHWSWKRVHLCVVWRKHGW